MTGMDVSLNFGHPGSKEGAGIGGTDPGAAANQDIGTQSGGICDAKR